MNTFKVADLKENTYFTDEVFLDKTFILLNNATPLTKDMIKALQVWSFTDIYSEGTIQLARTTAAGTQKNDFAPDMPKKNPAESLERSMEGIPKFVEGEYTEDEKIASVQSVYDEYLKYVAKVYTRYATHKELDIEEMSKEIRELCLFIKDNKNYLLRITPTSEDHSKNYLVNHSLRSTIISIAIGYQMRIPLPKLMELGITALLHEIGMLRLPPQMYITDRILSQSERKQIQAHPLFSFQVLKDANFPLIMQLGVLEHHEKENGTGYPQHLTGDKISLYAKIVAVACTYEAITASRDYKEASSASQAMIELLKNAAGQYDAVVIKALLFTLSLYPIGGFVLLKNGKIGQVVDVNANMPKNPIVEIPGERDEKGMICKFQTNDGDLAVVRALTKKEVDEFVKKMQSVRRPILRKF
ncbi:MAG: HD-GYP domain-containing protein [Treponema sp.]|nr:HD-GYP domain-containing protein [Treponema sp.]